VPSPICVLILEAAGRESHNFNTVYGDDPGTEVVAFTAAQMGQRDAVRRPVSPDGLKPVDALTTLGTSSRGSRLLCQAWSGLARPADARGRRTLDTLALPGLASG
jgi:hypothetical protein